MTELATRIQRIASLADELDDRTSGDDFHRIMADIASEADALHCYCARHNGVVPPEADPLPEPDEHAEPVSRGRFDDPPCPWSGDDAERRRAYGNWGQ